MADLTPEQFAQAVLHGLGIKPSPGNVKALVGWQKAEGGHWNNKARYNPLNTTMPAPGAGNTGSQGNIKVYRSWDQGVNATVKTLKNGLYGGIISALRSGNPGGVANAIGKSPWGTGGSLVAQTIGATAAPQLSKVPAFQEPARSAVSGTPPVSGTAPAAVTPGGLSREQILQQYLTQRGRPGALLGLAQGLGDLQTPAAAAIRSVPRADATAATTGASMSGALGTGGGRFKPGDPVLAGTSIGGRHETAGLAGYPAKDYFAKPGTVAVAPVSGRVVRLSGHDPAQGPTNGPHGPLGWSVYIQGSDGHSYFLTHMGSRTVKVGQTVKAGQPIGTVANYDKYGTPSHIHMGVK